MGVFIKGLQIPNNYPVGIIINPTGAVFVDYGSRFEMLEAVDVPAPHGRLIDADAFQQQAARMAASAQLGMIRHANDEEQGKWLTTLTERTAFVEDIGRAPSIIEAEDGH